MMDDKTFRKTHADEFDRRMNEARSFVNDPALLKRIIEEEDKDRPTDQLLAPRADPFTARTIRSKGYLREPLRLKNIIIAEHQPPSIIRDHLPIMLDIEPVSRCNFRCVMCVTSQRKGGRAPDLSFEDYETLMQSQPQLVEVKLQGIGEPLLHPRFCDMIKWAVERDIWVRSTVNGSLLHKADNAQRLIDSGIGEVQISFDGTTKEVFEDIRRGSDFDRVVDNATILNRYANTKDRPYTRMWSLVQAKNRHQIEDFVRIAAQMEFRRLTLSVGLGDWGKESMKETIGELQPNGLSHAEEERVLALGREYGVDVSLWGVSDKYELGNTDNMCVMPFTRGYVGSDLRIVPCGGIGDPDVYCLGDAREFTEAWNGPAYTAFRKAHLAGTPPQCCQFCYATPEARVS